MIDSVQEFFDIEVNHIVVALGHVSLGLGHRLMGKASRPESVTVLGKRQVPTRLENLKQGLLIQSVALLWQFA